MERIKQTLIDIFKGVLIGCANIIPGFSGGTVAVVFNVFDLLIGSVNGVISDKGNRKRHLAALLPLLAGVLIGLLLFSRLISFLFDNYPLQTYSMFFGMVVGSFPLLLRKALADGFKWHSPILFLAAFALVLLFDRLEISENGAGAYTVFDALILMLAQGLAAATMVIPGLSGSFVMLLLGKYETAITALSQFDFTRLLPMAVGAVLGIVLIAKLMGFLLKRHYSATYAAIFGFVVGSALVMALDVFSYTYGAHWQGLAAAAGAFIIGAAIVVVQGLSEYKRDNKAA